MGELSGGDVPDAPPVRRRRPASKGYDPSQPFELLDRLLEAYQQSEELRLASTTWARGRRRIVDPQTYGQALMLKMAALDRILKGLEKIGDIDAVKRIIESLMEGLKTAPPGVGASIAKSIMVEMRSRLRDISTAWTQEPMAAAGTRALPEPSGGSPARADRQVG
jgi:hypothetical protein